MIQSWRSKPPSGTEDLGRGDDTAGDKDTDSPGLGHLRSSLYHQDKDTWRWQKPAARATVRNVKAGGGGGAAGGTTGLIIMGPGLLISMLMSRWELVVCSEDADGVEEGGRLSGKPDYEPDSLVGAMFGTAGHNSVSESEEDVIVSALCEMCLTGRRDSWESGRIFLEAQECPSSRAIQILWLLGFFEVIVWSSKARGEASGKTARCQFNIKAYKGFSGH
ncbi:hypothetical protein C8J56DRAFT_893310 [Mycena floridula]|nr:hypothetical protein C8J56DRAFT_893310 [Mycena floridula]